MFNIPLLNRIRTRGVEAQIKFWPGEPNSYGKNPSGKPLYRVIWSDSHWYRIGGCWGDNGEIEYRWAPYYAGVKAWVLEKWLSAQEFAGSKEDWERTQINHELAAHGISVYTMGPYPSQGWYEHLYTFPADDSPNMEAIVPVFEASRNYSLAQTKTALKLWHERQKKEWEDKVSDGIKEAQPAFGHAATNLSCTKPTGDTAGLNVPGALSKEVAKHRGDKPIPDLTPEELNLPQHGFSIKQRKGA